MMMAKDGEVAHAFQPLLQVSRLLFWRLMQASGQSHDRGLHFYEKFGLGAPRSMEIALHCQDRQPSRAFPRCFA